MRVALGRIRSELELVGTAFSAFKQTGDHRRGEWLLRLGPGAAPQPASLAATTSCRCGEGSVKPASTRRNDISSSERSFHESTPANLPPS